MKNKFQRYFRFIGLSEGAIVSCKLVDELSTLDTVHVTATNHKDWEILVSNHHSMITFIGTKKL